MSYCRNCERSTSQFALNQERTSPVLRHWLNCVRDLSEELILSSRDLLILPTQDLAGLMRRRGRIDETSRKV